MVTRTSSSAQPPSPQRIRPQEHLYSSPMKAGVSHRPLFRTSKSSPQPSSPMPMQTATPDLLITQEWGPVAFFRNSGGNFENATEQAGLADLTGWWKGLEGRDLDGDGDIDYVVTNTGTNTKYHANSDHPLKLFYGDLGGTGSSNIVEAKYEDDTLFPVRGLSCSLGSDALHQEKIWHLPVLCESRARRDLPTKTARSGAELHRNSPRERNFAQRWRRHVHFEPFPWQAQLAPQFGAAATELDGDGFPEIALAGNFSYPQRETTPMNAGLGLPTPGHQFSATCALPFRERNPHSKRRSWSIVGRSKCRWRRSTGRSDKQRPRQDLRPPLPFGESFHTHTQRLPRKSIAAGARVTVVSDGLPPQTAESKGLPLTFARQPGAGATATIVWPSGKSTTEHSLTTDRTVTIFSPNN